MRFSTWAKSKMAWILIFYGAGGGGGGGGGQTPPRYYCGTTLYLPRLPNRSRDLPPSRLNPASKGLWGFAYFLVVIGCHPNANQRVFAVGHCTVQVHHAPSSCGLSAGVRKGRAQELLPRASQLSPWELPSDRTCPRYLSCSVGHESVPFRGIRPRFVFFTGDKPGSFLRYFDMAKRDDFTRIHSLLIGWAETSDFLNVWLEFGFLCSGPCSARVKGASFKGPFLHNKTLKKQGLFYYLYPTFCLTLL